MSAIRFYSYSIIFFISYVLLLIVCRWIDNESIVFYQGNILLIFYVLLIILILIIKKPFKEVLHSSTAIFCGAIISYSFLTSFPVILDRSITLHMYHFMNLNPNSTLDDIRSNYITEFVYTGEAIEKRLNEQIVLGNIVLDSSSSTYELTNAGVKSQHFFEFLNFLFSIKPTYENVKK